MLGCGHSRIGHVKLKLILMPTCHPEMVMETLSFIPTRIARNRFPGEPVLRFSTTQ